MEGAAEGGIVGKRTGDGFEAPVLELLDERLLQPLHDDSLLIEHQDIELSQRLHIEGMRHGMGFGSGAMRMSHEANIGGSRLGSM